MEDRQVLDRQIAYYRARAGEYDEWFLRKGRYDYGSEHRERWNREAAEVEAALRETVRDGDVLEFACGTGLWTRHLAEINRRVTALDASPEVIEINRARVGRDNVEYRVTDLFAWTPDRQYDAVFFSFWLSHVPRARFEEFWELVRRSLRPGGTAFFIDSMPDPTSTAVDQNPPNEMGVSRRRLNDGREFDILKIYYEPAVLQGRLEEMGWRGWVKSTAAFFLYGQLQSNSGDAVK
ncbi:MAG TPA: class I SAM-dependent methyltransferase [Bryobacteraceae bacterium]